MKKQSKYAPILSAESPQGVSLCEQGLALSIPEIFQRMVLGEMPDMPDTLGEYDTYGDDLPEIDPMNCQGLTLDDYQDLKESNTSYLESLTNSSTNKEEKEPDKSDVQTQETQE